MNNKLYWKMFERRSLISFIITLFLMFVCILRIAVISNTDYTQIINSQNRMKIKITDLRGSIFDCNLVPLTNQKKKIIAAVYPTPRAITAISTVLKGDEKIEVLDKLKSGKPIICEVPTVIYNEGIDCEEIIFNDTQENKANHIIGYTDADNRGVSGLQKAYDDILYSEEAVYAYFETDGKGKVLQGTEPEIKYNSSVAASGVVTTIDINIQNIIENEAENLKKGAIIVAESKTNKIKGILSRPDYENSKIEEALKSDDSPLLNKAILNYNVGSVFKPCVAIAGIENHKEDFWYNCTGKVKIIDRFYKCHELEGHGIINLETAIAKSCNTYFYNYSLKIGGEKIYNTSKNLQFGNSLKLCDGIETAKGRIPSKESLENPANLANFSIGQGELLASPVSLLTLYSAIATDGKYNIPSVVEGILQNGKIEEYNIGNQIKVMSSKSAEKLRKCLEKVFLNGTAKDIKPTYTTVAGKTATAQTGKWKNGVEICEGWFCGFFPAEKPVYTVIVFCEDTSIQEKSSAEIFVSIADKVSELKNLNTTSQKE